MYDLHMERVFQWKRFKKLYFNLFWVRFEGEALLTVKQPRKKKKTNEGLIKSGALRAGSPATESLNIPTEDPSIKQRRVLAASGHKGRSNAERASSGSTQGLVATVPVRSAARDRTRDAGSPVRGWLVCPSVSAFVFAAFVF